MAQQTRTLPSGIVYSNELVMADAEGAEETDAERRQRQQAERIAELRAQREA